MNRAFEGKSETDWLKAGPQGDFARLGKVINITEDVRKYSAEHGVKGEDALKAGLDAKAKEFNEAGAELYAKA